MPRATKKVKNKNELPATKKKRVSKRQAMLLPKTGVHLGLEYDSLLELSFIQWAEELMNAGYVSSIHRAPTLSLTDNVRLEFTETGKKRSSLIMRKSEYTPDFLVVWNEDKHRDFVWMIDDEPPTRMNRPLVGYRNEDNEICTMVEIKPIMDRNQSVRIAVDRIKFTYDKHGIFVNLVKPELFYEAVFPPNAWLFTATGLDKRLKYVPKTLNEYLKTLKK